VVRRSHPTDGRQVNLELTAKGAAVSKRTGDAKRTWVVQAIAQLPSEEQETLFAAGEIMRRMVESGRN
jgi:DNA-binding MarR family transcriptional regulator